ncbi:FGGY-family carbohydrate kinase [Telmatospirillum sp.]|uniref:xylulokinase n=1 Tax=Telmatospirillum sp. TaxID=2079197 RepID=UPI00283D3AE5|nr:FGGY-family carbohydrate kinase [Telmatospirillum sp.]MDR3438752.1 FGGY-family carbohydrate kinase [Telmatospirillum sp.]
MTTGPYVLAVDLGTSGPKVTLVSLSGAIVASGRAYVETIHTADAGVEQDAEAIWTAVKQAIKATLSGADVRREDIVAIGCASQFSSIVAVDGQGRPTMNMLMWADKRGTKADLGPLPNFPSGVDRPWHLLRWLRVHGIPPVEAGTSLGHMRFIKFARPDVYERTAKFLEPMDYLNLRLSGRAAANQCTAFLMLLVDNRTLNSTRYDPALVRASLIDREKLPDLLPCEEIVGTLLPEVAEELGLAKETKVVGAINDTQAGALGSGAFLGNAGAIAIGSTSVMFTHVPFKRTDVRNLILSMPSPVPDKYFVMAENGVAGAAIEHFFNNLVLVADDFGALSSHNKYQLLQAAVESVPSGADGVMFLPWLSGAWAPCGDAKMRGGFINLSMNTTRRHLARAILEGVALNMRWLKGPTERFAKRKFSHFVFHGGGAESSIWAQIMADVLTTPVHQIEHPQFTSGLGIASAAFTHLGMTDFEQFQRKLKIKAIFDPNKLHASMYEDMSEKFIHAFKATRSIYRKGSRTGFWAN